MLRLLEKYTRILVLVQSSDILRSLQRTAKAILCFAKESMRLQVTFVIGILITASNTVFAKFDHCGTRMHSRSLMLGEHSKTKGMWPWQVGIYKYNASNWDLKCGGALIDQQWVLTAAHCFSVKRRNPSKEWSVKDTDPVHEYKVKSGDHDLMSNESTEQESSPLEILVHPGYKPDRNHENDIALIKLSRKLTLSNYVRTVCLPGITEELTKPGAVGTVVGWGLADSQSDSKILLYSTQSILNNNMCHRGSKYFLNETVTFCAHDNKSMPCYGDGGSNMVRKVPANGQHRWVTIGIFSWGGCSIDSKYGFYTRVQSFVDWIWHKTKSWCLDPGPPLNGLRAPAKRIYQQNDVVIFGCNANYSRIGKAVLSCKQDGTWNGYKPICLASCSDPGVPRNGVRFGDNFQHGRTVMFMCIHGYKLTGKHFIICNDGRWNQNVPKCIGKTVTLFADSCSDPGVPRNGVRFGNNFQHGCTVMFMCTHGYKLTGKHFIVCNDGRWNPNIPKCAASCANPGKPVHGKRLDHFFHHNDKVRFSCDAGWKMDGEHTITCNNGRWNHDTPKCILIAPCIDPGLPLNGRRYGNNFQHGGRVSFTCRVGKELVGSSLITCNDGKWSRDIPKCLTCNIAPLGMMNKKISHSRVKASTRKNRSRDAKYARLNGPKSWCSRRERSPYLEIDLDGLHGITHLATQGSERDNKWVTKYKAIFISEYGRRETVLKGNKDATSVVKHKLNEIFIAKRVRIFPLRNRGQTKIQACMRVEIYGCDLSDMYTQCGESRTKLRTRRMVGGNRAGKGTWPWQVGMYKADKTGNLVLLCGGALIDKRWVLTTAHCFYTFNHLNQRVPITVPAKIYSIIVGDYHLQVQEPDQEKISAHSVFLHPRYDDSTYENDIALIKLEKDVKLGPFVRTICLPNKGDNLLQPGKHGIVAGWGTTQVLQLHQQPSKSNINSKVLQHSAFTIQSNTTCKKSTEYPFNQTVTFCAGDGRGGNDTCRGDAGGSFFREVLRDGKYRWVTAGLVSWGEGCGLMKKYGFYTKVEPFIDWIKKIMKDN